MDFVPGQRWISDTELQMGLGTVVATDHRSVTIVFLATGETRVYSKQTAPLTRVKFSAGDRIQSHEGWSLKVGSYKEQDGLLTYIGIHDDGSSDELPESDLDNFIQLNRPSERLFSGQIDRAKLFELRYQTRLHGNRLVHSDLYGLTGGRTSLIAHQLYIAHEVAGRYAPRVLLADEVGLGKTIEAGLILHQQLLTERARRILIVVPETLLHQWLVEMLRRFNLPFCIFDDERCQAIEESTGLDNPFHGEQLVLCRLEFLTQHPVRYQQALKGDWDLLVVDEAHHLVWSEQHPSIEYQVVERLAANTRGVLLLTATPEQLGKSSHFARLRLLDPDRFPDFASFEKEEGSYQPIAQAVEELLTGDMISGSAYRVLVDTIKEEDNRRSIDHLQDKKASGQSKTKARHDLIEHLLDRHGTGRVLFRNTRAAIQGFPKRQVTLTPLPLPEQYQHCTTTAQMDPKLWLCPEKHYQQDPANATKSWTAFDPRVNWLIDTLKALKPKKILVITAYRQSVVELVQALRTQAGIHAATFHGAMSIVERDRAAAFFANQEEGSQVLVCSEIGSEGRNFQFAHHIILFDLPLNPDLLEQRIGRLDRIGQSETIQIHVPYLENSAQAIMAHWYHEGLSAFENTCPAGHSVYAQVKQELLGMLQKNSRQNDIKSLINKTRKIYTELNEALHNGRDQLLEYNSCRPQAANQLKQRAINQDLTSKLPDYLESIFDCFGVDIEDDGETRYVIRPSGHMHDGSFPSLPNHGMTITYDRNTALANEDVHFITWEHPLVIGAMDMLLTNEPGNTALTAIKYRGAGPGTLLLECMYVLETASSGEQQHQRYLPPTVIRIVVDKKPKDHSQSLTHDIINQVSTIVDNETAKTIVRNHANEIRELLKLGERLVQEKIPKIVTSAHEQAQQTLGGEIDRLKALQLVNRNVRDDEIHYFEERQKRVDKIIEAASFRLDALRVIVVT